MLTAYLQAAMQRARYKLLEDRTYFGAIHNCPGVWANESTLERCRDTLRDVLEEWLIVKLRQRGRLPAIGSRRIVVSPVRGHTIRA